MGPREIEKMADELLRSNRTKSDNILSPWQLRKRGIREVPVSNLPEGLRQVMQNIFESTEKQN